MEGSTTATESFDVYRYVFSMDASSNTYQNFSWSRLLRF